MSNNGSGYPVYLHCPVWRRSNYKDRDQRPHILKRTGRTKPLPGGRTKGRIRQADASHEYVCSCGHIGWTSHMDIVRCSLIEAA